MPTIVIDPGHYGGYNAGVCFNYYEGNTTLVLANYIGEALKNRGADVRYTRTSDSQNPDLDERGSMAADADLFLSVHTDASDNPEARGVTSYYSVQRPNSQDLAVNIGEAVAGAMDSPFRGASARPYPNNPNLDYYGVIRAAVAAGADHAFIIEHGFHTNPEDCQALSDHTTLKRIAQAEADVIADYFGLPESTAGCCNFRYMVRPGESLYDISQKFQVAWQRLASQNDIYEPYIIYPGQTLIITLCS